MSNEVVEYLTENDVVVVLNCHLAKFGKRVIAAREKRDKKLQEEAMKAGFELVEDSSRKGADAIISRKEMVEQVKAEIFKIIFMILALFFFFFALVFYLS
ncbi:unnamed protein product [Caenorhabditis brenneri]